MTTHRHLGGSPGLAAMAIVLMSFFVSCSYNHSESDLKTISMALKAQADDWDRAIISKNLDKIGDNMSADFRHIGKTGDVSDKATFLREIISPDLIIHPYSVEEFDIRVYGDCALLSGRTRMTGIYEGKPFQSHYRYVDTYIRHKGKWVVCQVQITAIPESPAT